MGRFFTTQAENEPHTLGGRHAPQSNRPVMYKLYLFILTAANKMIDMFTNLSNL